MSIDHEFTDEIVCPWCGYEHEDSWEQQEDLDLGANFECDGCGKKFSWSRSISVSYSTERNKCEDKCDYKLDEDRINNPYIYDGRNWTIWKCSICNDKIVKVGEIAKDGKPYLQEIEDK